MMLQLKNTMPKQHGFSLIEAIVAFLILSIGMLGIASLQMLSLKAGHTAELRTLAVIKAEEMFERIRNNPAALDSSTTASYVSTTDDLGTNTDCAGSLCTYTQMARDDIYHWKIDLKDSLPNNDGTTASIAVTAKDTGNPTATVTITINWQERNQGAQSMDAMNYSVTAHICDNVKC